MSQFYSHERFENIYYIRETYDAVQVVQGMGEPHWIPKSQIKTSCLDKSQKPRAKRKAGWIDIPKWLGFQKELV